MADAATRPGRGLGGGPRAGRALPCSSGGWARSCYEKGEFKKGLHADEQNRVAVERIMAPALCLGARGTGPLSARRGHTGPGGLFDLAGDQM